MSTLGLERRGIRQRGVERGEVDRLIAAVRPPGAASPWDVRRHLDCLTKPRGSLGYLERLALRLAMIYGDPPPAWGRRLVVVFAGDHGVARQGVSAYPPEVTAQMCRNYAGGGAAVCAIARVARAEVVAVDIGVDADLAGLAGVIHRKVRRGTRDLSVESALTADEVCEAIVAGAEVVGTYGPDVVGLGEMGIANTTAASAVTAAFTGADPAIVVGRGTGIGRATLERKCAVVRGALARLAPGVDPIGVLAEVGGLEIAGLVGATLAAAARGRAVITDGFIATAAALAAVRLCPAVRRYLFASHRSVEPGHRLQLRALRLRPIFELDMRLGEGTGAALAIPVLESAAALLREMATFESAVVSTRSG